MLSLEEFAKLVGVSIDTARGWRDRGQVATVKVGRRVLIDAELTGLRGRAEAGTLEEYNQLKNSGLED